MKRRKGLIILVLVVAMVGAALPYLPLDFLKPQIERALQRGIGRRIEIDHVFLTFFSGPGFSLSGVTIDEDPRAGIEPFLYAGTVEARVDVLGLLRGRRGFASLRLSDATLTLVRTTEGPWNFQMLLAGPLGPNPAPPYPGSATPTAQQMPAIRMRAGRLNLKYGQSKSVLYFDDADLDVSRNDDASLDLRFSGVPGRTDRSAESFSHVFLQGTARPTPEGPHLDVKVDMEPASLDGIARLIGEPGFNAQAMVTLTARLSGPPTHLDVTGSLQTTDVHASGFLTQRSGLWQLDYKGTLDAIDQKLELSAAPQNSMRLRLCGRGVLQSPQWDAAVELRDAPLAPFIEAARRLGVALPDKTAATGAVSGEIQYSTTDGASGSMEIQDAALTLPGARPLKADSVRVSMSRDAITMSPAIVTAGGDDDSADESAQVDGTYSFDESNDHTKGLDLKVSTRGLRLAGLESLGIKDVPLIERISRGSLRGALGYRTGVWSGDYELRDAQVAVEGLASPVHLTSASVSANADRVTVTKINAIAGETKFHGEYRWEPKSPHPHKFRIEVDQTTPQELEKLFQPALLRGGGLLARTFRLGATAPTPDWLAQRQAEGTVSVRELQIGDHTLTVDAALVVWEGTDVRFSGIDASLDDASVGGQAAVDLSGAVPRYYLRGKLGEVPYSGGSIDFDGRIETGGTGLALLAGLHAEGSFKGRSIAFSPDAEFRSAAGRFTLDIANAAPRWKLTALEVTQGNDTYSGDGSTQPDGRLVLDLSSRGRQVHYTGPLVALAPQP